MDKLMDEVEEAGGSVKRGLFEVSNFKGSHRGIVSSVTLEKGSELCKVPFVKCFSSWKGRHDGVIGKYINSLDSITDVDALAILLMYSRVNIDTCELREHVKLFPDIGCGPAAYYHLLFWEDEELDFLQGTKAYNVAYDARDTVRGNYIRLLRDVFLEHPDVFPMYDYTLRLYQWAIATIWSRGMTFTLSTGEVICLIVPICDMFNHDPSASVSHYLAIDCNMSEEEGRYSKAHVGMLNTLAVETGNEIFISYGNHHDNSNLLHHYGMALENNPAEFVEVWFEVESVEKRRVLSDVGIEANQRPFKLTMSDPLPADLVRCISVLAACDMEENDLELLLAGSKDVVSGEHRLAMRELLMNKLEDIMNEYPDNLAGSVEELETEKSFGSYSLFNADSERYKYIMALITRVGELEILEKARSLVEEMM